MNSLQPPAQPEPGARGQLNDPTVIDPHEICFQSEPARGRPLEEYEVLAYHAPARPAPRPFVMPEIIVPDMKKAMASWLFALLAYLFAMAVLMLAFPTALAAVYYSGL